MAKAQVSATISIDTHISKQSHEQP